MKKILIVEDDIGIRESLCDILEISGYDVSTANNGKQGFDQIMETSPDLVICDINMPVLNGYELLGALTQRSSEELLPTFIFLTAKVDNEDIRQGMNLGADDYVTKPFDHNELLKVIQMRLEKREKLLQVVPKNGSSANNLNQLHITKNFNKLAIPSSEGLELIKFDDIVRCEADRAYCNFYLSSKSRITVSKPLKEFEAILLENNFLKIHKSHIVNLNHIEKYVRGTNGYLVLSDNSTAPVSTRKKDEVLTFLRQGE